MSRDIKDFVLSCPVCAQNKPSNRQPAGLLQPLPVPERPWSHIALDFVTGPPSSSGMTTILTIVDRFSKACHLIPLRKLPSALQTAQLLVKHVFRLHGIPHDILSDRGPQFTSRVWKEFASALGARYTLTSGYHPQTNGQTERMNQELESALRCLTSTNPSDWSQYLPWIEYAHNSHVSTATGISPFEASLGYQPPLFPSEEKQIAVPSVHHHIHRCRQFWTQTNQALLRTAEQNHRFADCRRTPAPQYHPGQRVWLSTRDLPARTSRRKLAPRYTGPYEIISVISPTTVRLRLPSHSRVHPSFHVSQIKPVLSSPLCPLAEPPPPSQDHQGRKILRILDSRRRGKGFQSTGMAKIPRTGHGFPVPLSLTSLSSLPSC
uniref:Integrase catalytic domain-containing protein n=1 Tax=Fundulus heteroclitus TaxID=8078 RepID=A0A3Q2NMV8_FUNHE